MGNTVTQEHISDMLNRSEVEVRTVFGKCTIVSVKLPNGFVITESSACVDPANYNEKLGASICMDRIESKLWELEGYRLQCELYNGKQEG